MPPSEYHKKKTEESLDLCSPTPTSWVLDEGVRQHAVKASKEGKGTRIQDLCLPSVVGPQKKSKKEDTAMSTTATCDPFLPSSSPFHEGLYFYPMLSALLSNAGTSSVMAPLSIATLASTKRKEGGSIHRETKGVLPLSIPVSRDPVVASLHQAVDILRGTTHRTQDHHTQRRLRIVKRNGQEEMYRNDRRRRNRREAIHIVAQGEHLNAIVNHSEQLRRTLSEDREVQGKHMDEMNIFLYSLRQELRQTEASAFTTFQDESHRLHAVVAQTVREMEYRALGLPPPCSYENGTTTVHPLSYPSPCEAMCRRYDACGAQGSRHRRRRSSCSVRQATSGCPVEELDPRQRALLARADGRHGRKKKKRHHVGISASYKKQQGHPVPFYHCKHYSVDDGEEEEEEESDADYAHEEERSSRRGRKNTPLRRTTSSRVHPARHHFRHHHHHPHHTSEIIVDPCCSSQKMEHQKNEEQEDGGHAPLYYTRSSSTSTSLNITKKIAQVQQLVNEMLEKQHKTLLEEAWEEEEQDGSTWSSSSSSFPVLQEPKSLWNDEDRRTCTGGTGGDAETRKRRNSAKKRDDLKILPPLQRTVNGEPHLSSLLPTPLQAAPSISSSRPSSPSTHPPLLPRLDTSPMTPPSSFCSSSFSSSSILSRCSVPTVPFSSQNVHHSRREA